jgi:hypothetical protein
MPKDLLTPAQAWEEATFFSIDTNLIQAAGYNFAQGALHQLPTQLPESMGLQLPEIVVSEVVKHRMESVHKAHRQMTGAIDDLQRLTALDASPVRHSMGQLNAIDAAAGKYTQEVHDYAVECRGAILPIAGSDAMADLFADYFAQRAPFGLSERKKSEFPDAMCLWLLERYAKDNRTVGIIASNDKGWKQYAEDSDWLYCVGSIDELAALFVATTDHADAIKGKISGAVIDADSPLGKSLTRALEHHIENATWDASEVYSGSVSRVEAEVYNADLAEHRIDGDVSVWFAKGDPNKWLVELTVQLSVNAHVSVEFFAWDGIDREELSLGSESFAKQVEIDLDVYLTCTDVHLDTEPSEWHTEIEIADGSYSLDGFEVEPDLGGPDE